MDAKDEGEAGRRMNWGDWCGEVSAMPMSDVDTPVALGGIHEGDWGGEAGAAPRTDVLADEGGRRCCGELEGLWAADRRRPCGEILCPWGWYGPTPMPAPPCNSSCARVGRAAEGRAGEEEGGEEEEERRRRRRRRRRRAFIRPVSGGAHGDFKREGFLQRHESGRAAAA